MARNQPPDRDTAPAVQRLRRRYARELELLAPGTPTRAAQGAAYAALRAGRHESAAGEPQHRGTG